MALTTQRLVIKIGSEEILFEFFQKQVNEVFFFEFYVFFYWIDESNILI